MIPEIVFMQNAMMGYKRNSTIIFYCSGFKKLCIACKWVSYIVGQWSILIYVHV